MARWLQHRLVEHRKVRSRIQSQDIDSKRNTLSTIANKYATTGESLFSAETVDTLVSESSSLILIQHNRELTGTENGEKEYRGQWRRYSDGQLVREGLGILTMEDGSFYSGQFIANEMTGLGRMQQTNGNVYQGEWREGKANGHGVFEDTQQNATYDGDWVDDLQHGFGKETINGG